MNAKQTTDTKIYTINTEALQDALCPGFEVRSKICLIVGPKGYVVTDNECIHLSPAPITEPLTLSLWQKIPGKISIFPSKELTISIHQLIEFSETKAPVWKQWIHYFGIKPRIHSNFLLLKKSVSGIGANIEFPQW